MPSIGIYYFSYEHASSVVAMTAAPCHAENCPDRPRRPCGDQPSPDSDKPRQPCLAGTSPTRRCLDTTYPAGTAAPHHDGPKRTMPDENERCRALQRRAIPRPPRTTKTCPDWLRPNATCQDWPRPPRHARTNRTITSRNQPNRDGPKHYSHTMTKQAPAGDAIPHHAGAK